MQMVFLSVKYHKISGFFGTVTVTGTRNLSLSSKTRVSIFIFVLYMSLLLSCSQHWGLKILADHQASIPSPKQSLLKLPSHGNRHIPTNNTIIQYYDTIIQIFITVLLTLTTSKGDKNFIIFPNSNSWFSLTTPS